MSGTLPLPLPVPVTAGPNVYACVVVGDSMNGDGIRDGDLIIVDRGQVPVDGDMAVVLLTWKGKRGRVLKRLQEGGTVLESSNPHWPPMHLTPEADPQILGRVIGVLAVGEESCRPAGSTPFSR